MLPKIESGNVIGTRTLVLADSARHRELLVTTWFPAQSGTVAAPYLDKRTGIELAREWKLHSGFEQSVCTHSWLDTTISHQKAFPVVLLEHGSGVVPAIYASLAEGLASSGFIVVATNHPPDSLIAVYPDGHEIKAQPYWPENADRRTQGVAIGKFAEDVLVADVRFVLDQLQQLNSHDSFWPGHLDLSRVAIVGHSMDFVDGADIRVIECRGGTSLAAKAFQRLWVPRQFSGQEFQRNESPKLGVFRFIDHTHTTAAQLLNNAVVRDNLVDHAWRRNSGLNGTDVMKAKSTTYGEQQDALRIFWPITSIVNSARKQCLLR